ncbi:hypothetical protein L249_2938, partial [Ophiocordyceps polyrhachis-furcata BCC 54312]
ITKEKRNKEEALPLEPSDPMEKQKSVSRSMTVFSSSFFVLLCSQNRGIATGKKEVYLYRTPPRGPKYPRAL